MLHFILGCQTSGRALFYCVYFKLEVLSFRIMEDKSNTLVS